MPTLVPVKKDLINDFNMASRLKESQLKLLKPEDDEQAFNMIVGPKFPDDVEMHDN